MLAIVAGLSLEYSVMNSVVASLWWYTVYSLKLRKVVRDYGMMTHATF